MTKILLVEDDKSLREIYGVRLLAEGYDIVSAGDGEEALAMAIKERPALILSDVMMPKISGFDMLDILRSTTETRDIKVIMMTALSSEDQRLRGEKLGADRYLVKSQVGIEDVVRTVHDVLGDLPNMASQPTQQPHTSQPPVPPRPADTSAQSPQQPAASPLPQPMAPFSSPMPRPAALGDRVLQPIQQNQGPTGDIGQMIEQELSDTGTPAQTANPYSPPAGSAAVAPPTDPQADDTRPTIASLSPQQSAGEPPKDQAQQQPSPFASPASPGLQGMPTHPNSPTPAIAPQEQ